MSKLIAGNNHGGARKNAGRKKVLPDEARRRSIIMTDAELEQVKKLLEIIRGGLKDE